LVLENSIHAMMVHGHEHYTSTEVMTQWFQAAPKFKPNNLQLQCFSKITAWTCCWAAGTTGTSSDPVPDEDEATKRTVAAAEAAAAASADAECQTAVAQVGAGGG
jgi:hypothetical protein